MVYHAHCAVTPWSKTQHIYLSKFKYLFNIFGSAFSLSIVIELKRSMKSNCHGDPLIPPVPPSPPTLPLRPHLGVGQQGVQPHLVPHPTWTLRRRRTTAEHLQPGHLQGGGDEGRQARVQTHKAWSGTS